jgi:Zn-dependent protease with chaperone function
MSWTTSDGINAFAAGHKPGDATVTVTRGCMNAFSRDELQGVIGHEFSHILNGDMRLNFRLIGTIFGMLCLAIIGRILAANRARRRAQPGQKSAADSRPRLADRSVPSAFFLDASFKPPSAASANFSPTLRPCNSREIQTASPAR